MKKQIVLTLAALALLTSACGKDASFKNASQLNSQLNSSLNSPANSANQAADPSAEAKAEAILSEDVNVTMSKTTDLSLVLLQEVRGVTLSLAKTTGEKDDGRPVSMTTATLTVASVKNNECPVENKTTSSFKLADASQNFVNLNDGGRFRCLEEACENILLIMESSRYVKVDTENGKKKSEFQFGNLSVLLKKSTDGTFKPVSTESVSFAQLQDAKMGELNCIDEISSAIYEKAQKEKEKVETVVVTTPASGHTESISDRVRTYQAALIAKEKATKVAIEKGQIPAQTSNATQPKISVSDRVRAYQAALIAKDKADKLAAAASSSTHQVITPVAE